MINRILKAKLQQASRFYPVVSIMGPRQSGKTTLVRDAFRDKDYVSLEDLDVREFALRDPRGFLGNYPKGVILDEVQRAPELFSYIQTIVDEENKPGKFILTGSLHFLLQENITQTLAGRAAIYELLPFSVEELESKDKFRQGGCEEYLFKGFYPRIYDKNAPPAEWYRNYIKTYIERDVKLMKNISDLSVFRTFLKMCASRTGQMLNLSSLANDCGITHNTAKSWISVLENSFIIFLLRPHHKNFNKRLVKMPKLYFYDTGLLCSLLGIGSVGQLETHYLKGGIFETFVLAEMRKFFLNRALDAPLYFWRDKTGHEIDCIAEGNNKIIPIEIKSGKTVSADYFKNINYWLKISGKSINDAYVIYGGEISQKRTAGNLFSWRAICGLLKKMLRVQL
ncbi:ATP-binding protein [bacterium]|nr:ATP-binding protein [Candidatus Omnitrophota bacterium]MBU3929198.1 ATP-binding protein [bacterium]MBU4123742.1 ATP-binding protein [bacterium]